MLGMAVFSVLSVFVSKKKKLAPLSVMAGTIKRVGAKSKGAH